MDSQDLPDAISRFGVDVYRIAYSQMGSRQAAEDVYQEVFVKLWRSAIVFESDEHLRFWLCRVTVNQCRDAKRLWRRQTETLSDPMDLRDVAEEADVSERGDTSVFDLVDKLPDDMKEAVHLHYVEGYSTREIAEICDCSSATVRTRLFRARKRIKAALEEGNR